MGTLIIVIGVGIFGTFTGYLANLFLSPRAEEPAAEKTQPAADEAQDRLAQLKQLMAQQQAAIDEIEQLLLEKKLKEAP